ncbi:MAG TPA: DUF4396 domain-containing protein [Candidatus Saccharimonadales bacterium]
MRLVKDELTKHAIRHTVHCLIGCGIGEILGMLIASSFGWHRIGRVALAVPMAFLIGYTLTYRGIRKDTATAGEAIKATMATDTVSILSMEIIDNTIEFLVPNALLVTATQFRFWWGLALALAVAFVITVPVNRYMMSRGAHQHMHH